MANTDIPLSQTVQVEITTVPTGAASANFGVMLLVTQENPSSGKGVTLQEGIVYFSNMDEVALRYPLAEAPQTYAAANTYFAQEPTPLTLGIGRRYTAAQAGTLQGGTASTVLGTYTAITTGSLKIGFNGVAPADITGINLSTATSINGVAPSVVSLLDTAITGGTVSYNDDLDCFTITSVTTGATSAVSFASAAASGVDISDIFKFRQGQAIRTDGVAIETAVGSCLDRLEAKDGGWYGLAFTKETRDNGDITTPSTGAAAWCEDRVKQLFTATNQEVTKTAAYIAAGTTDTASALHTGAYKRTSCVFSSYPDQYPEISAFARAATVNFEFKDSVITLKFKQLPGITTEVLNTSQLNNLTSKGCNVYMRTAGVNMLSDAMMAAGEGYYQDTTHNTDWLQDDIQKGVFNALYTSTTKIPETDDGVARLIEKVIKSLERGVNNGMIARDSYDTDDVFYPKGYTVSAQSVASLPAATRARRIAPPISFKAIGAGAIHKVVINGVFVA